MIFFFFTQNFKIWRGMKTWTDSKYTMEESNFYQNLGSAIGNNEVNWNFHPIFSFTNLGKWNVSSIFWAAYYVWFLPRKNWFLLNGWNEGRLRWPIQLKIEDIFDEKLISIHMFVQQYEWVLYTTVIQIETVLLEHSKYWFCKVQMTV